MSAMTSIDSGSPVTTVGRAARAAGCAFVSLAVWMGIAYGVIQTRDCTGEGMQCLGDAVGIILLGLIGAALTMWPLLRLAGVRPAWPVVLAGPFTFVLALPVFRWLLPDYPALWVVGIMLAYAVAAWLTDGRVPARNRWLGVVVLFALVVVWVVRGVPTP
jgi:hypothetical protein